MKFTLRVTLLTILLTLIALTVAGLGVTSYFNTRNTVQDLSGQILDQTSQRIDQKINALLLNANDHSDLTRRLIQSGRFDVHDMGPLAAYWQQVLQIHPKLIRIGIGLEENGDWYFAERLDSGSFILGVVKRDPKTGEVEERLYNPGEYPKNPKRVPIASAIPEIRQRPWYVNAKKNRRQTWAETSVLADGIQETTVPGITCATPVYRPDGQLEGVVAVSYDLYDLCLFLHDLPVGNPAQENEWLGDKRGYAFVVEFRKDGSRQIIAHPKSELLLRPIAENDSTRAAELVPTAELKDPHVKAFLDHLPPDFRPSRLDSLKLMHFEDKGVPYLGGYQCLSSKDTPDWLICLVIPEDNVLGSVRQGNKHTLLIGVIVFAVAVLLGMVISRQVARPLESLALETEKIGQLHLAPQPVAHSLVKEVDRLAVSTEVMKTQLRSFRKFVPADLVRSILAQGQEARPGGESRVVTIYFCDIVEFTALAENMPPTQVVDLLGHFLQVISEDITATGGTVDKYIGDAVMAFWGAPAANPDHALAACRAALANQKKLAELRTQWQAEGKPLFFARGGLHTGEVVVGNIGSEARLNYTVIGDSVNLASRMESLNRYYGTQILITDATYQAVAQEMVARPVDWVAVKGRHEGGLVYELLGVKGQVDSSTLSLVEDYSRGLAAYHNKEWGKALEIFEAIALAHPHDGPTRRMLEHCAKNQSQPANANGDNLFQMEYK